jgi:hypothetical protein
MQTTKIILDKIIEGKIDPKNEQLGIKLGLESSLQINKQLGYKKK